MLTRIIQIGNSRGIRIPKQMLQDAGLQEEVLLETKQDSLVIHRVPSAREGWAKKFASMVSKHDDLLFDLEPVLLTQWEKNEWQWK